MGDASKLHEMVFEALCAIDLSPQLNVTTFMNTKWTTFLVTFEAKWGENGPPGGSNPDPSGQGDEGTGPKKGGPVHVRFGPVTKQGQWSGEMRTRGGAIAFCNCWNAFPKKPCNRGVYAGANKGKCAYTHKCRYCMSTQHGMDDKDAEGKYVCPRRP